MPATALSAATVGIDAIPVHVEVDTDRQLPSFTVVGLPDGAVRESKERVMAAVRNAGFQWPRRRVTVNLAPADIRKEGSAFDLPIAVGILAASGQLKNGRLDEFALLGELSLDGSLRPVRGALPVALGLKKRGVYGLILPQKNGREAAIAGGPLVYAAASLRQAVDILEGDPRFVPFKVDVDSVLRAAAGYPVDFADVRGQAHAKRAIEVAAAGGHNIAMVGSPGSGKTMLARRMPTILPDLTLEEALDTTRIHSVAGALPPDKALVASRPFRAPHHSISDAGLIGGGSYPRPGEVSLAHHGVLFLDELPEFRKHVIEALRQPVEDHQVTIARAAATVSYPARFMLVAAMNPCPCGFLGDPQHQCGCSPYQVQRYRARISGPLLDRMDLHVEVPAVKYADLASKEAPENSAAVRGRVNLARARQLRRFSSNAGLFCNAHMDPKHIRQFCAIDQAGYKLLEKAITALGLSARAYDRILKVSRTIADLAGEEAIKPGHIAEAVQYRSLDRSAWN